MKKSDNEISARNSDDVISPGKLNLAGQGFRLIFFRRHIGLHMRAFASNKENMESPTIIVGYYAPSTPVLKIIAVAQKAQELV